MREDGGPSSYEELLFHYRAMAEEHRKQVYFADEQDVKDAAGMWAKAYDAAADELIRVMKHVGDLPQEGEIGGG